MEDSNKKIVQNELEKLYNATLSLILSTLNPAGEVETSYAPYAQHDGCYYIFVSSLAPHSKNLQQHPDINIMLIEDENKAKNIFARTRLSYKATASAVDKASQEFSEIITQLRTRAGKTIDVLAGLGDFVMFKIQPVHGRLILGFGKAYLLNAKTNEIIHVDKDLIASQKQS